MDWQWLLTVALIPASLGLWEWGKSLLKRWGEARIAKVEADTLAEIEEKKDTREHRQRTTELAQAFYQSEREVTNQAMSSVLNTAQEKEEKANEFIRQEYRRLTDQMVTQEELKELIIRVVTIDTYLRSIIMELRDERRRLQAKDTSENYEMIISDLKDQLETIKAVNHRKKTA